MRLRPVKDQAHTLGAMLGSGVQATTPYRTPWRVVMIADTPGQLIERNDIFANLNDPCAIADTVVDQAGQGHSGSDADDRGWQGPASTSA